MRFEYDVKNPSWFAESVVQKKPFITFLGPFSSGKSTFINYLMQSNQLQTGPQPLTDKFTVLMHGEENQTVSGRVLVADTNQPFRGLNVFGDAFVDCFQGQLLPHDILRSVHLIDTPGVLEAAGDIHARKYDYIKVCRWFIERSDLVFFLFDPTKLDAGMELRMLFKHALKGFEYKTRIVLNKADTVGPQELMRVYGALFWNLSNLINTTEPPRVYVSSFWDNPYKPGTNHQLFTDEKTDLLYELIEEVPKQSLDKRVTSVISRANKVLCHVLVCATLRQRMPSVFGKDSAKKKELENLDETFKDLGIKYKVAPQNFGDKEDFKKFFEKVDLFAMPDMTKTTKKGWIERLKNLEGSALPQLLAPIQASKAVDPNDAKHRINLSRQYQMQVTNQLAGQTGIQGRLGEYVRPENTMTVNVPDPQTQMMMMMQQMQMQQQLALPPAPVAPAGGMSQEQMMMMMQMMQQQQQQ